MSKQLNFYIWEAVRNRPRFNKDITFWLIADSSNNSSCKEHEVSKSRLLGQPWAQSRLLRPLSSCDILSSCDRLPSCDIYPPVIFYLAVIFLSTSDIYPTAFILSSCEAAHPWIWAPIKQTFTNRPRDEYTIPISTKLSEKKVELNGLI